MGEPAHLKVAQRKEAAAAHKEANRIKRAAKKSPRQQQRDLGKLDTMATIVLVLTPGTPRSTAWKALQRAETLRLYFKRYNFDEDKRRAIVNGGFVLHDLPFSLAVQIERELAPVWRRGSRASHPQFFS